MFQSHQKLCSTIPGVENCCSDFISLTIDLKIDKVEFISLSLDLTQSDKADV